MNILITGGCGFIASNFVNAMVLKYPHYNFINMDCVYDCSTLNNITVSDQPNYKFVKGNICSYDLVLYILTTFKINIVIHFAAQSHVDNSFANPLQYTSDNIVGSHTLIEACRTHGQIIRYIYMSTDEVYGESLFSETDRKTEKSILCPTNPYSATKAAAEMITMSYYYSYKFPVIIMRCNNVYGPRQYIEKLIPRFIYLLGKDQKCTIHGSGNQLRSFIHIDDVVSAVECIWLNGRKGEIYNISTDEEHSVLDVTQMLVSYMKGSDKYDEYIQFVKDRDFNDQRYYMESTKLEELGWSKRICFAEGLKTTIDWYNSVDIDNHWNIKP